MKRKRGEVAKKKNGRSRLSAQLSSVRFKCGLMIAVSTVLLMVLFCVFCTPKRYDLRVGEISHQTITAPRDIVDTETTNALRNEAAEKTKYVYVKYENAKAETLALLDSVLAELRRVQEFGSSLRGSEETDESFRLRTFSDDELAEAQDMLANVTLTNYQIATLLRTSKNDLENMEKTVRISLDNAMDTMRISSDETERENAIKSITQMVGYGGVRLTLMQNIVPAVIRHCVRPNMVVDMERLELDRAKAVEAVEAVSFKQGQTIIRAGDVVRKNQYVVLNSLGMLDNNSIDINLYLGGIITVAISMALYLLLQQLLEPKVLVNVRSTAVVMLVMLINMAASVGFDKMLSIYCTPMLVCAMLLTGLQGWRTGVSAGIGMSIMLSGLAAGGSSTPTTMIQLMMIGMIGSVLSVHFLKGRSQRTRIVLCGAIAGVASALCVACISLMTASSQDNMLHCTGWSFVGAVLSSVITLSLQPVFEGVFNLATPSKLLELGNPKQPLLRRLQLEAPGTYHHSIIVANLAEAAAEKIGANPLLARTGAYFHDIGKLKRPLYFAENQMGENPHDHTDPYVSAAIVTTHTRDGLALAQKHRLPQEIQNIIVEHHGDTPVMFFYHKALQQADGKPVDINDFRYDGRRPTTKEAAVIMLADTTEAAVRSMSDPTPESIQRFIEKLVRGKLEDGQLSNAPLTLRDLDEICAAFCTVLNGVFHERIEYPNQEIPARSTTAVAPQPAKQEPPAAPVKTKGTAADAPVPATAKVEQIETEKPKAADETKEETHEPVVGD